MGRGPRILPEEWLRSPEDRRRRRTITVDLEGERFDPIFQYATAVAPDRSVQESIRDLLLQAVADEPVNAAVREARRQAFAEVRERALLEVRRFFVELAISLDLEPVTNEARSQPPVENRIVNAEGDIFG